jgi:hypothetical protein
VSREVCVELFPGEALFLSCSDDLTVAKQTRRAIVIKGGYSENVLFVIQSHP